MREDEKQIITYLNSKYNIQFVSISKIKGTYKLVDYEGKKYALKVIHYELSHSMFILEAIKHLIDRGFDNILRVISTKDNYSYIKFANFYAYLTKWVDSRKCDFKSEKDIYKVAKVIARMHIYSSGLTVNNKMNPRIGWFSWINVFDTRKNEILDFKKRILQKASKDEFDHYYLENVDNQIKIADKSIAGLRNSKYVKLMEKQVRKLEYCHHDLANHNILMAKDNIFLIDFDYCILDTHIHDLSSFIVRVMKNDKWDNDKSKKIINEYSSIYPVSYDEIEVMKYFMMFPQDFWQIGLQKYWEQQPYSKDKYINKIKNHVESCKEKNDFLDNFC